MKKDPTAFRERFKAWKEGEPITDIYDKGLPKYDEGEDKKSLSHLFDNKILYKMSYPIRKRLYENIMPMGYDNPSKRVFDALVLNKKEGERDFKQPSNSYKVVDSLWGEYLGIPIKDRLFDNNKYGVSQYSENGNKYYRLNDPSLLYWDMMEANLPTIRKTKKFPTDNHYHTIYYNTDVGLNLNTNAYLNFILGDFQIQRKRDSELGEYLEYSDLWDINPYLPTDNIYGQLLPEDMPIYDKVLSKFMRSVGDASFGIGKPLRIKGKIPLEDIYGAPPKTSAADKSKGEYYGGWLPEILIEGFKSNKLPGFEEGKDPYRYLYDDQSRNWNRITDDENADIFANFVVTPNGSRPTFSMYENTPNPTLPVNKNEFVIPDNTLWTRLLVEKANNTRTWRSDVADVMHAIGEGAMLASTFAVPEVEPLVNPAYQAIKGIVTNAARSNASKILANPRNFLFAIPEIPPYEILNIPGYLLKILMRGNQLEKLLSGFGTVNVNNIKAAALKASDVEKEVIDKVLSSEQFAGQKAVDYNDFRKAVLDELITYSRKPLTRYEDYGVNGLGYSKKLLGSDVTVGDIEAQYPGRFLTVTRPLFRMVDTKTGRVVTNSSELQLLVADLNKEGGILYNTFTFESPRLPVGNNRHYDTTTLGHSRTYTTSDEPDVLHVMESQSDWALNKPIKLFKEHDIKSLLDLDDEINFQISNNGAGYKGVDWKDVLMLLKNSREYLTPQGKYLSDNYLQRLLQENLRYAAENGLTKMRYPTSETAAKIEGYTKLRPSRELIEALEKKYNRPEGYVDIGTRENYPVEDIDDPEEIREIIEIFKKSKEWDQTEEAKKFWQEFNSIGEYYPLHQTILKKYADFPKLYKKLYKDADVRTITDPKGNTWYEVDVPKDYLNQEWKYNFGKDLFRRTILRPKLKF